MEKPCHVSDDCGRTNPFFLYVRNSICKISFPLKKFWFILFALFMILPIQVTLLPNYILLEKLKLLNSWKALIIPAIFSPFGTVWLTFVFPGNPRFYTWCRKNGWRKSATNDSLHYSSKFKTCRYHIIYISIYRKLEYGWTAYPFSRKETDYPLSVFLASLNQNAVGIQSVCGLLCLLPVTFFFLYYNTELTDGLKDILWSW